MIEDTFLKDGNFLEIGKVVSVHGIKGFIKVIAWCDDILIFKTLSFLYLNSEKVYKYKIQEIKFVKNSVLIAFEGIDSIEIAQKLIGKIIYVKRSDLKIKKGETYIKDLIGVKIFDFKDKNIYYGKIIQVIKTGANDVYQIVDDQNNEKFVPVIEDVIIKKDLANSKIYIKPLRGLFDV